MSRHVVFWLNRLHEDEWEIQGNSKEVFWCCLIEDDESLFLECEEKCQRFTFQAEEWEWHTTIQQDIHVGSGKECRDTWLFWLVATHSYDRLSQRRRDYRYGFVQRWQGLSDDNNWLLSECQQTLFTYSFCFGRIWQATCWRLYMDSSWRGSHQRAYRCSERIW